MPWPCRPRLFRTRAISGLHQPIALADKAGRHKADRHSADHETPEGGSLQGRQDITLIEQHNGLERVGARHHDDDSGNGESDARLTEPWADERGKEADGERADE